MYHNLFSCNNRIWNAEEIKPYPIASSLCTWFSELAFIIFINRTVLLIISAITPTSVNKKKTIFTLKVVGCLIISCWCSKSWVNYILFITLKHNYLKFLVSRKIMLLVIVRKLFLPSFPLHSLLTITRYPHFTIIVTQG